jgi:hypothetical protein
MTVNLPWIPEPSRRFNLLFNTEGSGIQGTVNHESPENPKHLLFGNVIHSHRLKNYQIVRALHV